MRKLLCLSMLIGVMSSVVVGVPVASAADEPNEATPAAEEVPAGAEMTVLPGAKVGEVSPDSRDQCSLFSVCIWETEYEKQEFFNGRFAYWSDQDTGCHNHTNVPLPDAVWNRTNKTVRVGGRGELGSSQAATYYPGVSGEICF